MRSEWMFPSILIALDVCAAMPYAWHGNWRKNNHVLAVEGKAHTISEWARISGIGKTTIRGRLKRGWSAARAVEAYDG